MFLENVNFEFSIICFTETWLKEENVDCYGISGYNCEHKYRKDKQETFFKKGMSGPDKI